MKSKLKVLRREQCLRSRQHRGVSVCVIHETSDMEILRTEMEAQSSFDFREHGTYPVFHFAIEGSVAFQASDGSAELMPGDSVAFLRNHASCTVSNPAPTRSVILSIVLRKRILDFFNLRRTS